MSQSLLQHIASDTLLDAAFHWLCERRIAYRHNDDVWHIRFHRAQVQAQIQAQLLYRLWIRQLLCFAAMSKGFMLIFIMSRLC